MTDPQPFGEDTDTVPSCTGACCDPVTFDVQHYRAMSRAPDSFRNGRYILNMLSSRGPMPGHGAGEFDCRYFDRETRLCTAYDRRPEMCRTYPDEGLCGYCGGRFNEGHPQSSVADGVPRTDGARLSALRALIKQTSNQATKPSARRGRRGG
jgi:Fe-S-cluster containining protein